jgi:precorrin-3B C17-methyltransferase
MSGWVRIVGLGPGGAEWLTPEASVVLHEATDIVGYTPYVLGVPASVTAKRHASDNGVEVERAAHALAMARGGAKVAVVSGGDAGVFGMAAAVFEAWEHGETQWRQLDIRVVPGMTALLAAAARIGAPLGHDFCVISLSDYLKPWAIIERRLRAACEGDFVMGLYNPASRTRRSQIEAALAYMLRYKPGDTVAVVAASVGRSDERITVSTLAELDASVVDMRSLVVIGSSHTRRVEREGLPPVVYTPRYYKDTP